MRPRALAFACYFLYKKIIKICFFLETSKADGMRPVSRVQQVYPAAYGKVCRQVKLYRRRYTFAPLTSEYIIPSCRANQMLLTGGRIMSTPLDFFSREQMLAIYFLARNRGSLLFDGRSLHWCDSSNPMSWEARSGNEKYFNDFSIEAQKTKNAGPIPEGLYIVAQDALEKRSSPRGWILRFFSSRWEYNPVAWGGVPHIS